MQERTNHPAFGLQATQSASTPVSERGVSMYLSTILSLGNEYDIGGQIA